MTKIKYPTIPDDVLVKLNISTNFYRSLAQLLLGLSQDMNQEEYATIVSKMKNKEPASSIKELNIILITSLVFSVEESAKEQGLLKEVEVEVPDTKEIN